MAASGADAGSIADAACEVWRGIDAALSPIIGNDGVAALFQRSLHLARAQHPGFPTLSNHAGGLVDFTILHRALSSQTSANAADANNALVIAFYDVLSSLIGAPLTERLLEPVLVAPSASHTEQDPSQ
jgi:hypothetical protein